MSTPFYPQIKIKGVQIKIKGLQIKIMGYQIKIRGHQIKRKGLQIKIRGLQIKIRGFQIKIRGLQIKIKGIQIKTYLRISLSLYLRCFLLFIVSASEQVFRRQNVSTHISLLSSSEKTRWTYNWAQKRVSGPKIQVNMPLWVKHWSNF